MTLTANGVHQHSINLKRQEDGHTFTLPCVYYVSKGRQGRKGASSFSGIFLEVVQKGIALGMTNPVARRAPRRSHSLCNDFTNT